MEHFLSKRNNFMKNIHNILIVMLAAFLLPLSVSSADESKEETFFSIVLNEPENLESFIPESFLSMAQGMACQRIGVVGWLVAYGRYEGVPENKALDYLNQNSSFIYQQIPSGLSIDNQKKYLTVIENDLTIPPPLSGPITDSIDVEILNKVISAVYSQPDYSKRVVRSFQRRTGDKSPELEAHIYRVYMPILIAEQVITSCRAMVKAEFEAD
jgi:hypothetical protein